VELLAACLCRERVLGTHHDDGDGQQDPVEQSGIPVDGLYDGLGHDGRHGSGDAVLVLSSACRRNRCHFLRVSQPLPTHVEAPATLHLQLCHPQPNNFPLDDDNHITNMADESRISPYNVSGIYPSLFH
jgi:hypothetical protein